MKPRRGGFHRQFSPIPGNLPELEVHAPPEPEANHGPPKASTEFGPARRPPLRRSLHPRPPSPDFSLMLEIQQINPL